MRPGSGLFAAAQKNVRNNFYRARYDCPWLPAALDFMLRRGRHVAS
jgi:hypothetical protein